MFVNDGTRLIRRLSIFLLASCGTAVIAQETGVNIDIAVRAAMDRASQAVAKAKAQAHKCSLSGISNHTTHIADNKVKSNIYNCADSKGAFAAIDIGNQTISSGHDIKTK